MIINLIGGPGSGKSTSRAGLFHKMKVDGFKVEEVVEYAKELTYGKDFVKLSDQLLLLGKQHHRLFKLRDEVDYIVSDSPFIMGLSYLKDDGYLPLKEFEELTVKLFNSYDNLNIFLERDKNQEFQSYGRNQNFDEAINKDKEIRELLINHNIPFVSVTVTPDIIDDLYRIVTDFIRYS